MLGALVNPRLVFVDVHFSVVGSPDLAIGGLGNVTVRAFCGAKGRHIVSNNYTNHYKQQHISGNKKI